MNKETAKRELAALKEKEAELLEIINAPDEPDELTNLKHLHVYLMSNGDKAIAFLADEGDRNPFTMESLSRDSHNTNKGLKDYWYPRLNASYSSVPYPIKLIGRVGVVDAGWNMDGSDEDGGQYTTLDAYDPEKLTGKNIGD